MQGNILSQQVGGLMVGVFASIQKVNRSNGAHGQQWQVDKVFFYLIP